MHTKDTMVDKIPLVPAHGGLILVETQINNGVSDRSKCCEVRGQARERSWVVREGYTETSEGNE